MPTYRYPVLTCRDPADGFTAIPIDGGKAAFALNPTDARHQLRDHLLWLHKQAPWQTGPDFRDAELHWHTVSVRPEYRTNDRIHPCETAVTLKVTCVTGVRESGQPAADLPLLGIRFDYNTAAELPDLVRRYVLQKLEGLTPEEVSRFLPPVSVELADLPVRVPRDVSAHAQAPNLPPTLKLVAEPVGERAVRKGFARAWGREAEVTALVHKLTREKANVLLVGEPGVGKTTLLVDAVKAAEKVADEADDVDGPPKTKRRFWLTSGGRLVAGMKYLGQWEERVEKVIEELGEIGGVLCVDRLLDLIRRGGQGPTDGIAAFLLPYLARGEVRAVGEATPAELDACRRLLPGLADLFQIVRVEPFDRTQAVAVIDKQLATAAAGHQVEVARGTGERVVRLHRRFLPYAAFPGPASAFARELVDAAVRDGTRQVDPAGVVDRFRRRTGLPELFLRDEITLARPDVLGWFRARVIDQPEACAAAADTVMTVKAGLNDPARPPAVLLFCGPTGVGKTHMAQALADYFFGHGEGAKKPGEHPRLHRFDMSEYGGFDAAYRLFGPPTGDPGELVNRVRRQPFSVLLLDEVEKAAAPVFDALMGVFDEGRLTDQYGRVTNFRSTVIVMTSNLGAGSGASIGFAGGPAGPAYRAAAMKFFRPEFFNRLDAVVTFDPLGPAAVRAIARRELDAINKRDGIAAAGVTLEWADELVDRLAEVGFDARYGARPLQRAVERLVVAELAKWLLANPAGGRRTVRAGWSDGRAVFR